MARSFVHRRAPKPVAPLPALVLDDETEELRSIQAAQGALVLRLQRGQPVRADDLLVLSKRLGHVINRLRLCDAR